ncbi:MAG: PorV/PorQ family protein [Bacteroidia bacterium]
MNTKHYIILAATCLFFLSPRVKAQDRDRTPKYSNEFLNIGVGGRALGMGNSAAASVKDASATYWNPAGISLIDNDIQLYLMHSEYFAGIAKFDYGAVVTKLDEKNYLGFSMVRFGIDNIPNTLRLIDANGSIDYNRITEFSAVDYSFALSFSRKLANEKLRLGGSAKVIHRRIGPFATAWGFGLDAGIQYDFAEGWTVGAMGRDITSTFNAWSFNFTEEEKEVFTATQNEIPVNSSEITLPRINTGIMKDVKISDKFNMLAELGADFTFDGKRNTLVRSDFSSIDLHFGFEVDYNELIFLRGGVTNFQRTTTNLPSDKDSATGFQDPREILTFQPSIGVGFKFQQFALDYAFTDIGDQSVALYSHIVSLRIGINRKEEAQ